MNALLETWRALSWLSRLAILLVGLLLLAAPWLPSRTARPATPSQLAKRPRGVRQADFKAIVTARTTYRQVVTQLGEGTLVGTSADGRIRTYQWSGGGKWRRMEVGFRDSLAVSKLAFALHY